MNIATVLKAKYAADVVDTLIGAYTEIERNFVLKKWKASELDSGHFVEAARRILEAGLTGTFTPVGTDLPKFNDNVLKQYENAPGHESYRILIPRALKSIYNIRNKRGVGHVGEVSPNEMDSSYILYSCKWVLAEFIRLASGLSPASTQKLVNSIVERQVEAIWKEGGITTVLNPNFTTKEQVLILLFDTSPQSEESLRKKTEYKNPSNFRGILRELHKKKLLFRAENGDCTLSPTGLVSAESLIVSGK